MPAYTQRKIPYMACEENFHGLMHARNASVTLYGILEAYEQSFSGNSAVAPFENLSLYSISKPPSAGLPKAKKIKKHSSEIPEQEKLEALAFLQVRSIKSLPQEGCTNKRKRQQSDFTLPSKKRSVLITPPSEKTLASKTKKKNPTGEQELGEDCEIAGEYATEIYEYLRELEMKHLPTSYFGKNPELTPEIRAKLVDWITSVHFHFRLLHETFHLAIHLLDRFLSLRNVSRSRLQLVAIVALLIAAKFKETMTPCVDQYVLVCDGGYSKDEFVEAERYMFSVLGFCVSYPDPVCFLRHINKVEPLTGTESALSKCLIDTAFFVPECVGVQPSKVVAAAVLMARKLLNSGEWYSELAAQSGYSEEELIPITNAMINFISRCWSESSDLEISLKSLVVKYNQPLTTDDGTITTVSSLVNLLCQPQLN